MSDRPYPTRVEVLRRDLNPAPGETGWVSSAPPLAELVEMLQRAERGQHRDEAGRTYSARVQVWLDVETDPTADLPELDPEVRTDGDAAGDAPVRDRLAEQIEARRAATPPPTPLGL